MRGFKLNLTFLLVLFSANIFAEEILDSDLHYILGYQAFLSQSYGECADQFYLSLNSENSNRTHNAARLYLSLCQAKIGNKSFATYNMARIDPYFFTPDQKLYYGRMKKYLGKDLDKAKWEIEYYEKIYNKLTVLFLPYYGLISYTETSIKDKANFYGVYGMFGKGDWSGILGAEQFNLQLKNDVPSYTQTQGFGSISKTFDKVNAVSLRYSTISSPQTNQSGINTYGLGYSRWATDHYKFYLDGFFSIYPNSDLGSLKVSQLIFTNEYWFKSNSEFDCWSKFGIQSLYPSAPSIADDSSFIKSKLYNRYFAELNVRVQKFIYGINGWKGDEVFGVRNDGALIFSGIEKHLGGYNYNFSYLFNTHSKLQLTYMKEIIQVDYITSYSKTILAMFTYHFF
jgi:hypothetical protein